VGKARLGSAPEKPYPAHDPEAAMKQQTLTMQDAKNTAKMLSEALPYLQRFTGAVVVVKFGGNAMGDDAAMAEFARDIVLMRQVGVNPVVVHGGGPMINEMLTKLGIKSDFVRGKRVTDKATVEVVEMILSGLVNKRIVQAIMDAGGRAVGISGKDDDLMVCEADDPELGFVGRPIEMNVQVLRDLYTAGIIPVIAPVGTGMQDNETFNVNGDTAAGAIAGALQADRLLLLTDVPGVKNAAGEVMTQITPEEIRQMTADGVISGGMIPKTETALMALDKGTRAVTILDGRIPNACLIELFTDLGAGSQIRSTAPRVKPHIRR
jgi:acetylglutamate kinase